MKKELFFIVFFLIFLVSGNSYAYTERNFLEKKTTVDGLKSALVMNQKWVPYPAYSDRAGWDLFLGNDKAGFIRLGEEKLGYQWQVVKATDYIEFERSGSRDIMQKPYNENNQAVSSLIMAELAEGKGRFIDQIINGVYLYCEMTSWALSAHLSAQLSNRSLPDYKEDIIDLTAGDVGSMLSWTYYFFHDEFDKVNPAISERLRHELQKRILNTYMDTDRFWWMAFNLKPGGMVNNWNPWCNFNVLQCFLLLENDTERLARAVYRTMVSVDKFINYTHSDGACEEGPSYWGHAAGKMYDYLQLLSDGTAGRISIFDEAMIKNMGEYISRSYVGNGWVVNFADASVKGGGDAPLIYRYGKAINSKEMMSFAAYLDSNRKNNDLKVGTDLFRGLQTLLYRKEFSEVKPEHITPSYTWYPETEFCYIKNSTGFFFASKGGYNDESHNHNDAGTFSLYLNTVPVIIDAGVGTYTRQTFSSERYSIWTMQSNYHNLPMINGIPQSFGARFKATDVVFNPKKSTFSLNIATAYPAEACVSKWIRSYTLGKDKLVINDSFRLTETRKNNQVNFLVWGKIDIKTPGKVMIETQGEKIVLSYNKDIFTADIQTIMLDDPRLSNIWGKEIYRVSLNAGEMVLSGNYSYTITK
ncbi:MAG: heparinase II/III-family protein [Tannerella sp.]|jgi:hypothetical protein|nr:heparinase II/III-family protein [Tannerella sp.]